MAMVLAKTSCQGKANYKAFHYEKMVGDEGFEPPTLSV